MINARDDKATHRKKWQEKAQSTEKFMSPPVFYVSLKVFLCCVYSKSAIWIVIYNLVYHEGFHPVKESNILTHWHGDWHKLLTIILQCRVTLAMIIAMRLTDSIIFTKSFLQKCNWNFENRACEHIKIVYFFKTLMYHNFVFHYCLAMKFQHLLNI